MEFRKICLDDADRIRDIMRRSPSQQLVYCFEAFYLWRDIFDIEYAETDGLLMFKMHYDGKYHFFFPIGSGDLNSAVIKTAEYCAGIGIDFNIIKVNSENLAEFEKSFYGNMEAVPVRDNFEYIYTADRFRTYSGSALQPKRNFVNYAMKNYDWVYEAVNKANLGECIGFAIGFTGDDSFDSDNDALLIALNEFGKLNLNGGIIRIDGEIAAILITTMLSDGMTAAGLFLRGDHEKKGVIPLLYKQFFINHPEYTSVNLAEDLGIEGLRKNKLSYHPDRLLELYDVRFDPRN